MRRLDCGICLQDIEDYYDTTVSIIDHNQRLLSMAADTPPGAKILSSGRVLILRDGVSRRRFIYIRPQRLKEFFQLSSISNQMLGCCSNLHRRPLPRGTRRTGFWQW